MLTRYRMLQRDGLWRVQATILWFMVWRDIASTTYGVYPTQDEFTYSSESLAREALQTFKSNERKRRAPWRLVQL